MDLSGRRDDVAPHLRDHTPSHNRRPPIGGEVRRFDRRDGQRQESVKVNNAAELSEFSLITCPERSTSWIMLRKC
jgi:hypothetical protein